MAKEEEPLYFTARHLLDMLANLDHGLLDRPLVLIHGKALTKPRLIQGFIPSLVEVDLTAVEDKSDSLLAVAELAKPRKQRPTLRHKGK